MAAQSQVIPVNPPFIAGRKIRALIADGTPDMQTVTAWILERDGQVEVVGRADNGVLAVSLAEALNPDLVVLDVNMPKMSGFEATLLIKEHAPETKVLIISSDDDPELGLCALDCGADGFMWKGDLPNRCHKHLARLFGS